MAFSMNRTRNVFGVADRSGPGATAFIIKPASDQVATMPQPVALDYTPDRQSLTTQFLTPKRSAALTLSSRLPIEINCYDFDGTSYRLAHQMIVSSAEATRSAVRGQAVAPFASLHNARERQISTQTKTQSLDVRHLGSWVKNHPRREAPTQAAVMARAGARDTILQAAHKYQIPLLSIRESASPNNHSHWMHLIGYSHSDSDPQTRDNLVAGSAGANYDHIIFENTVKKILRDFGSDIVDGNYRVDVDYLPVTINEIEAHAALKMTCTLEVTFNSGHKKGLVFILDPTKAKLTDSQNAKRDEEILYGYMREFVQATPHTRHSINSQAQATDDTATTRQPVARLWQMTSTPIQQSPQPSQQTSRFDDPLSFQPRKLDLSP